MPQQTKPETGETADVESGANSAVAVAADELQSLRDRIRAFEQERDGLVASLQRVAADFENYKQRIRRDMAEERRYCSADLVREMLPALDNLQRALDAAGNESESALVQGVALVRSQLLDVLRRFGVTHFDPTGQPFDATLQDAVRQQPSPDARPGTVVEVLEPGYRLHERVLRPAKVVVAAKESAGESEKS